MGGRDDDDLEVNHGRGSPQRTDLHGRYVTHLFYSDSEISIDDCFKDGTYLNAELVEASHAEIVA